MKTLLAAVLVALALAAGGAAAPGPVEPMFPMVSPNGAHIAWVEGSTYRIWSALADGTNAQPVGAGFPVNGVNAAAWTKQGFVVDSSFTLYLITTSGKRIRLGPDGDFTFSVGGGRVASGSGGQPGQTGPVRIVDLRTRRATEMGFPRVANVDPALSPRGTFVAWVASGWLWVARVGGVPRGIAAKGSCPQWSPDGKWIAYLSPPNDQLRVISPAGGTPRTIAARVGGCDVPGSPAWSPDSTRIAVGKNQLTILDVRTGKAVRIVPSLGRVAGGFAWTPDGTALYASIRPAAQEQAAGNCLSLWQLDAATLAGSVVVPGCP